MINLKSRTPYHDILNMWWQEHKINLSLSTVRSKEMNMRAHILPAFGDCAVGKINKQKINEFVAEKLQHGSPIRHPHGLSAASVTKLLHILGASLRWACEQGYIATNPVDDIKFPKGKGKEIEVFAADEVSKLIVAARPKWMGDIILLGYRTGMRRGEMYGLQWRDIDWDGRYLSVRRIIGTTEPHEIRITKPKTKRSVRRIDLDNVTMEMLQRRYDKAAGIGNTEWVFEDQYGHLICPWYTTRYMRDACIKAGIKPRGIHTLRHTHATLLLAAGVHPKIVQERLGHSTIAMTLDTYSHMIPTIQAVAVDVFNRLP